MREWERKFEIWEEELMAIHERREWCVEDQWMSKMAQSERTYDTWIWEIEESYQSEMWEANTKVK